LGPKEGICQQSTRRVFGDARGDRADGRSRAAEDNSIATARERSDGCKLGVQRVAERGPTVVMISPPRCAGVQRQSKPDRPSLT